MISGQKMAVRGLGRDLRKAINLLQDQVKSQRLASGKGYRVGHTSLGQKITLNNTSKTIGDRFEVRRFRIIQILETSLECQQVNDSGLGIGNYLYRVMRPRATWYTDTDSMVGIFDSSSVSSAGVQNRNYNSNFDVVVDGSTVTKTVLVEEEIYPAYSQGDTLGSTNGSLIYAIKPIIGGTVEVAGSMVPWLDLNVDARHWAMVDRAVEVCIDGQTNYMLIRGSGTAT